MTQHEDRFREAFESHEHLAPNMGAVYRGSQVLYRRYLRRRRSVQVVGSAVLGAGLLAAYSNLPPSLLPGATLPTPPARVGTTTTLPAAVPSIATSLSPEEYEGDLAAYDRGGYGYDEAVRLAALWHTDADISYVKAEAGRELIAGRTLPVPPHPISVHSSRSDTADESFSDAGYTYDDAVRLARLWNLPDAAAAKTKAGTKLEAGFPLPFSRPLTPRQAFWNAGYDSIDADKLARLWKVSVDEAKAEAGQRLLRGEKLPFKP